MKNTTKASLVAALLAGITFGQPPRGGMTTPPDPATIVAHQVARLTTLLNLTTDQATQATTIFTDAQNAAAPLETTLAGYRTSMQDAVKSGATATIDQLAASIGTTTGQITAIRSKAEAAFYAILTTDQQTRLNAVGDMRGGPGPGGFRPGFRGGPR